VFRANPWRDLSCGEWEAAVGYGLFHDERGGQALHAGQGTEAFVVDLLVGGEIGGDDVEEVVGVAEQSLCRHDGGHGGGGFLEVSDGVAVPLVHRHEDDRAEPEVYHRWVDVGVVAAYDAGGLELAQAALAARDAEGDPGGELRDGQPPFMLEKGKDLAIGSVHRTYLCANHHGLRPIGNHFAGGCTYLAAMDPTRFAAFILVDLMLVMTPGADWAYAITAGVRGGRVLPAVAGLAGGYMVQASLVVAGVGAVLAESQSAMQFLTYLGAAYLLWLGVRVARAPAALPGEHLGAVSALRGAATSGLNPKGVLLFFAVLPQFVTRTAPWPVTVQLAVLGAVHIVACAVVYCCVAMGARRLLRSRPRAARIVAHASGIAMVAVAVALVIERTVAT